MQSWAVLSTAAEADIGIAGGDGCAVIFRKGRLLRKVKEEDVLKELLSEIDKLREENRNC